MATTGETRGESPLLLALARFASSLTLDRVPPRALHEAKLCLLDTVGCILAGADAPEAATFREAERRALADGAAGALAPAAEARVLGYLGDVFELNDLVGGHASLANVSAVLAVARRRPATGADLARALIAGIEITARLFEAQRRKKRPLDECGITGMSMVSAIGAAGATALLVGLPEAKLAAALAIAGANACWGPAEVIFGEGGTIKPMQFGASPADTAVRAVGYADAGLTGPARLLESRMGMLATLARSHDPALVRADDRWYLLRPQRKLHACCGMTHASLDALRKLRREGADLEGATALELGVPRFVVPAVVKARPPATANDARFHLQYLAALVASGAEVITPEHSLRFEAHLARPEIAALMAKTSAVAIEVPPGADGPAFNHARVRARYAGGAVAEATCGGPRGSAADPIPDAEVVEKFRRLAAAHLPPPAIERTVERTLALERERDCGFLLEALGGVLA